jgi:hypothetical protein
MSENIVRHNAVPEPVPVPSHNGKNGKLAEANVPLENYAARQKSVSFLASLMDRWK